MIKNLQRMLVGIIFALPVLGFITIPDDYVVKGENRRIAQFPEFGHSMFFATLQNYFNDRLLFKNWANENLYTTFTSLFDDFNYSSAQFTIVGEKGWLFAGNSSNDVYSQHCEDKKLDVKKTNEKISYLASLRDLALENDATFDFVIGPDKHGIYPEFMNRHIRYPGKFRYFDKQKSYFDNSSISYIDLFDLERSHKDPEEKISLYYTDDTHWNSYGAHFAFEYLMKRLEGDSYVPFKYDFEFKKHENGDLVGYLNKPKKDILDDAIPSRDGTPVVKWHFYKEGNDGSAQLQMSVNLNYNLEYFNENAVSDKTIMMITDSYGFHMSPFFIDYYSHVIILHRQMVSFDEIKSIVQKEKPSHILYINVERNSIKLD